MTSFTGTEPTQLRIVKNFNELGCAALGKYLAVIYIHVGLCTLLVLIKVNSMTNILYITYIFYTYERLIVALFYLKK